MYDITAQRGVLNKLKQNKNKSFKTRKVLPNSNPFISGNNLQSFVSSVSIVSACKPLVHSSSSTEPETYINFVVTTVGSKEMEAFVITWRALVL